MSKEIELPVFYEDLTPPYIIKRKKEIDSLRELLIAGDFSEIQKIAHKIAGSGGSYGLEEISRIGKEMEVASISEDALKVKNSLEELSSFLNEIKVLFRG
ncbi:MAG: Hpt domain-containing protein [Bacteriovoracaceae bacterium]|nr:Hpt domain-containing protein [Bacteriovoracaceae bacterium]